MVTAATASGATNKAISRQVLVENANGITRKQTNIAMAETPLSNIQTGGDWPSK